MTSTTLTVIWKYFSELSNSEVGGMKIAEIIMIIVLVILSMSNNVKSLQSSSYYGFYAIVVMVGLSLLMVSITSLEEPRLEQLDFDFNYFSFQAGSSQSIAVIILSFSFHTYTFSIYDCLEKPTTKKMMVSTSVGVLISTLCYLIIGSTIYVSYGEKINEYSKISDILGSTTIGFFINLAFCINVLMSFPISFFSVKSYAFYAIPLIVGAIKELCARKPIHEPESTISKHSGTELEQKPKEILESAENERNDTIPENFDNISQGSNQHNAQHGQLDHNDQHDHQHDAHGQHDELNDGVKFIITILLFASILFLAREVSVTKYVRKPILIFRYFLSWDHSQPT